MTDEALVRLLAASERANELLQKASAWSVAHEEARLRLRDLPPALAAAEGTASAVLRGLHSEMVSEFHSVTAMRLPEQESMGSGLSSDSERALDTGVSELVHLTTQSLVCSFPRSSPARIPGIFVMPSGWFPGVRWSSGRGEVVAERERPDGDVDLRRALWTVAGRWAQVTSAMADWMCSVVTVLLLVSAAAMSAW